MELSAEVVEGEEDVGERQVLGAQGSGHEWRELGCPAHPHDVGPGNPTPCCALSGIPSWRPQGAGPVAAAAAHQCIACRGPRPAEPHPRSPAVRTGDREWGERQTQTHSWVGRRREGTGCKAGSARCSALPCLGRSWPHLLGLALCPFFSPSPQSLLPGQMGVVTYHPSPHHTHPKSLEWCQSKHLAEWDKQVGRGGAKQVKPVPDQAPPSDR